MPEPTSSSTPTFDQPTSMDDDSTMDITSVSPNTRLDVPEALNISNLPEKQVVGITQDPPPTTSTVAFIGINYVPDSANSQMSSRRLLPPHPTPWDSVALQSANGNAVAGHSSFPPKLYVMSACLVVLLVRLMRKIQAGEAQRTGFLLLFWTSAARRSVLHPSCGSDRSTPSTRDCSCGKGLLRG